MQDDSTELRLAAPAKLNLALRIVGRRADGYHELESLLVLLDLADELRLAPGTTGLRVHVDTRSAEGQARVPRAAAENLAWRGLLAGLGGEPDNASLELTKRVPVMAGLGGGSSDAAAGWRLGRRRTRTSEHPNIDDLASLVAIGADVPFFAAQMSAARVSGVGDWVEPAVLPAGTPREVVLSSPPFSLATAAVFAELQQSDWGRGGMDDPDVPVVELGGNDLLAPARRLRPELDEVIRVMRAAGADPHLSGSGPSLFALFSDPERADGVAERLRALSIRVLRTRVRSEPASIETVLDIREEQR